MTTFGRFRLIRRIGAGGMAEVFLASARGPGGFEKTLAVKRILPAYAADPKWVGLFLSEAQLSARLSHPNIVQVFDFGECDGEHYIAMEYVDGPSLRAVLDAAQAKREPLPFTVCARIAADVGHALSYAHHLVDTQSGAPLGVIHRDATPENILISRTGVVKVADFGIARGVNAQTRATSIKGKFAYVAPEQLNGGRVDHRSDLFGLGVVLFEMLALQRPFSAPHELALMQAVIFEPHPDLTNLRPGVPPELVKIVDRALAKNPDHRFRTCSDFAADLEAWLSTQGHQRTSELPAVVEAYVPSGLPAPLHIRDGSDAPTEIDPRTAGRRRLRRALPAVLAAAALLAAGGLWAGWPAPKAAIVEAAPLPQPPSVPIPTPAATALAQVQIVSEPPALVRIAGQERGKTPLRLTDAPVGPLEVELVNPDIGFRRTHTVELRPGDNGQVAVAGRKGHIEFRIYPWARVVLDGRDLGVTPLPPVEVWEGTHRVTLLDGKGRPITTQSVDVAAGERALVRHRVR